MFFIKHCRDNVTMIFRPIMVDYCITHRDLHMFRNFSCHTFSRNTAIQSSLFMIYTMYLVLYSFVFILSKLLCASNIKHIITMAKVYGNSLFRSFAIVDSFALALVTLFKRATRGKWVFHSFHFLEHKNDLLFMKEQFALFKSRKTETWTYKFRSHFLTLLL